MFSISNFFFTLLLIIFGLLGFNRGLFTALFSLLGLLVGYVGAVHWSAGLGRIFSMFGIPGVIAVATAGGVILVLVFLFFLIPAYFLNQWQKEQSEDHQFSMGFKAGGAVVGVLTGSIYAMMLVWLLMFVRATGPVNVEPPAPTLSEKITILTVQGVTSHIILDRDSRGRPVGVLISQLLSQPERGIKNLRRMLDHPLFLATFMDATFIRALQGGNETEVETHPAMQRLLADGDFISSAYELGLMDPNEEEMRAQRRFAREFAFALTHAYTRIESIKKNPEAKAILDDEEFNRLLSEQNMVGLLLNARFNRLLEIIFNDFSMIHIDRERGRPLEWFLYASGPKGQEWTRILSSNSLEENLQTMLKAAYERRFQYPGFDQAIADSLVSLESLSAKGHASAQFKLAVKFANGWDVPLNASRAVALLREASTNHNDEAAFHLAAMTDLGWGVSRNPEQAMEMMEAIAGRGFQPALHCMALMVALGRENRLPSLEGASEWFRLSAKAGSGQAYFFLGFFSLVGQGLPEDMRKAYQYFSLAKEKGFVFDQRFFDEVEKRMLEERDRRQRAGH